MDLPRRGREGRGSGLSSSWSPRRPRSWPTAITARVVRDTVRSEGELVEDTLDWYAQDSAGNVWYMGEDTAEFENGKIVSRAGSFEAGAGGALPGILLPAEPQVGQKYRQEYLKGEAEDNGEVLGINQLGRGADRTLQRCAAHQGYHQPRAGRRGVQALRTRHRAGARPGHLRRRCA